MDILWSSLDILGSSLDVLESSLDVLESSLDILIFLEYNYIKGYFWEFFDIVIVYNSHSLSLVNEGCTPKSRTLINVL